MKYSASVLMSIFKRKGGEGLYTKVITKNNSFQYMHLFSDYIEGEVPLIIQHHDDSYWVILTNLRIIIGENVDITSLWYSAIHTARAPVFEEYGRGVKNILEFTLIELILVNREKILLEIEGGLPYMGILHILIFIASKN